MLVLCLTPLGKGSCTVSPPEHPLDLFKFRVLTSSHALVSRELPNVLEASLPKTLGGNVFEAASEVTLTLCMRSPCQENGTKAALHMAILIVVSH